MDKKIRGLRALSPEEIAIKLRAYRRAYDLTQEELAEKIQIPRYTLHRWESALVRISPAMLRILVLDGVL